MRVLIVHERYSKPGGEDAAVDAEMALLKDAGLAVELFAEDNTRIVRGTPALAAQALWSFDGRRRVAAAIDRFRPDVLHVHNAFPLLSASIYGAAVERGIPVVQTLHNFRLLCANALLLRDGRPCECCVGKLVKWPGVVHGCYRGSRAASAVVGAVAAVHQLTAIRNRAVDRYIALSPFSASRFVAGGLPAERMIVCPPVLREPDRNAAAPVPASGRRTGGLLVGRLSPEKGIESLIAAWRDVPHPLTVIGDGPLAEAVRRAAPPQVRFLGWRSSEEVAAAMAQAALLLFPSLCYENFPLVVAEAMAHGLPVLAASGGAVEDTLEDGRTGAFAPPGDVEGWRIAVRSLLDQPERLSVMGAAGRAVFRERYGQAAALARRLALYEELCGHPAVSTRVDGPVPV